MSNRLHIDLSPEQQVLVWCARADGQWLDESMLELFSGGKLNWDRLLEDARMHRLSGLLYLRLQHPRVIPLVPEASFEKARQDYLQIMMRDVYLDTELRRILTALAAEDVPVVLLKGAALKQTVYTEPGARPMSDIDILVPGSAAAKVQQTVMSLGYSQDYAKEELAHAEQVGRHLPRLQGIRVPCAVEVHRHLVSADSPIQFEIDGFWKRSVAIDVGGIPARVFCPEDQLIHLALNFMLDRRFHSAASLGQLADIAAVVDREGEGIDWNLLRRLVDQYSLTGLTGVAFELAHSLLGAPIPETARPILEENAISPEAYMSRLATFARTRVFTSRPFFATVLDEPGSHGVAGGTKSFWRRLVPTRRYLVGKYGEPARGLLGMRFYAVRLFEGLRLATSMALHPGEWRDNVQVNRWMLSLSRQSGDRAAQVARRPD